MFTVPLSRRIGDRARPSPVFPRKMYAIIGAEGAGYANLDPSRSNDRNPISQGC